MSNEPIPCSSCGQFCGDQFDQTCDELRTRNSTGPLINVPREMLQQWMDDIGESRHVTKYAARKREELRALLAKPADPKPTGLSQGWNLTRKHDGFVVGHQSVAYPPDESAIQRAERDGYVWVPFLVPAAKHQGEPVYQLRNNVLATNWRDADKAAYDSVGDNPSYERRVLYTHPAEQPVLASDQWPKLEKPALVGAGRFSAGLSARLVVEAAQRHYEYEITPEKETLRIATGENFLALLAQLEQLRGLRPALPPRPPEGNGLPRYGLRWNGPQQPLAVPMDDGYWTPWHLAALHQPDQALCKFYDVTDYPGLIRELVGHVSQLQDSAKRNVKPWEDTFPPTLLPAYIDRINAANQAELVKP